MCFFINLSLEFYYHENPLKMNKFRLAFLVFFASSLLHAQSGSLSFDGENDCLNIGSEAGNNIRTIELWFKLNEEIDAYSPNFSTLIQRQTFGTDNQNEFALVFNYSNVSNPGCLRFKVQDEAGQKWEVVSDNNQWAKNRWYHVAAVLDPMQGMLLFINGKKQSDTAPDCLIATTTASEITGVGCKGNILNNFFNGSIDDLRLSSIPRYQKDFVPPCPNLDSDNETSALYHFEEGAGQTAKDSGPNNYN